MANVPYVDATAEMYCLQGAPSIYSDRANGIPTNRVQKKKIKKKIKKKLKRKSDKGSVLCNSSSHTQPLPVLGAQGDSDSD